MNSVSCLRRFQMPFPTFLQRFHNNPLFHPCFNIQANNGNLPIYQPRRSYAFKSNLTIKWVRPTKIPCQQPEKSGDLENFPKLDLTKLPSAFQTSKELQDADEVVKRLFSLQFLPKRWARKEYEQMLGDRVRRHAYDTKSYEVLISRMTARIRFYQWHIGGTPKDVKTRVICKELIEKRKKYLKFLRRWDYKKFEWLLDKLNIIYRPPPKKYHWITRKESLRKLTRRHCLKIRQERILAYKKHLESQQERFLIDKMNALDWIRKEELACGVETTVTDQDILDVQKKLEELKLKKKSAVEEVVKITYNPEELGL